MTTFDWELTPIRVVDGDTVRAHLRRWEPLTHGFSHEIYTDEPEGVSLRLIIVDTPERSDPRYREARQFLRDWLDYHAPALRVETYGYGGWERLLADIYVDGDRGNTATQALLRAGYPAYIKTVQRADGSVA